MRRVALALGLIAFSLATTAPGAQAIPCDGIDVIVIAVIPVTPVCDRLAFQGMDSLSPDRLDFPFDAFTILFSGTLLTTEQGREVTLLRDPLTQDPFGGDFEIRHQTGEPSTTSWEGNFEPGDKVLFNRFTSLLGSDAIQLQFTDLVAGVGTQFQKFTPGPFSAQLQIFGVDDPSTPLDESLVPLATVRTDDGFACQAPTRDCPEGSAIFLGLVAATQVIKRAEFNVFNLTGPGDEEAFGINKVQIGTIAVPLPTSLVLLGAGFSAVVYVRRRWLRT